MAATPSHHSAPPTSVDRRLPAPVAAAIDDLTNELAGRLPATVPRGEISSQVSTALLDLHASVSRDSLPNGIVVCNCVYLADTRARSVVTMGTMR